MEPEEAQLQVDLHDHTVGLTSLERLAGHYKYSTVEIDVFIG
jgi:hypothetical protein